MNRQLVQRLLHLTFVSTLVMGLLTDVFQTESSSALAASDLRPAQAPFARANAYWEDTTPPPDDLNEAAMPLPAASLPAEQPFVLATTPERSVTSAQTITPTAPAITLWYGTDQTFGQLGHPQTQINLLGTVTGTLPLSLTYALNGAAALPLKLGPDDERLAQVGDFNVVITRTALISGLNQVVLTATDALSATAQLTATITYIPTSTWPQTYNINWAQGMNIQDVVQVVDGLWAVDDTGLRPLQFDFDRLVAIGDSSWRDYEVTVPMFVRSIDPSGFDAPSNGPGIGLIADWQGHTFLTEDLQVPTGWRTQLGALAWYRWGRNNTRTTEVRGYGGGAIATNSSKELSFNTQYIMKLGVQSRTGQPSYYRFKFWPAAQPEPAVWDVQGPGRAGGPVSGSLVLVAHHVDATFGDVVVRPLSTISSTLTVATNGGGSVSTTPQQPLYTYGQAVQLAASGAPGSFFERWTGDIASTSNPLIFEITQNTAITANFSLTPTQPITSTIISDDFNNCTLGSHWEFLNPLDDGTLTLTGTRAQLTVPQGVSHNVYNNGIPAPRIMQAIQNIDFEVVVKFESSVNRRFQVQGIIVEQDIEPDQEDFIRFDFFHDDTSAHLYAASIQNGIPVERVDDVISPTGTDMYLKVRREGNVWTVSSSFDNITYTSRNFSLTTAFVPRKIGVFAANHGNLNNPASIPSHTAIVDYFFNTSAPIANEDGKPNTLGLTVAPTSGGQVVITNPLNKTTFACGEAITLNAQPAAGFRFAGWSGAITGQNNPITFPYELGAVVTATFVSSQSVLYLPVITNQP